MIPPMAISKRDSSNWSWAKRSRLSSWTWDKPGGPGMNSFRAMAEILESYGLEIPLELKVALERFHG